jgi:hypothetical protein
MMRLVTDEVNLITLVLLVVFFAIKIALFVKLWWRMTAGIELLQAEIKSITTTTGQLGNIMAETQENMLRLDAQVTHVEARLDAHLLECNGVDKHAP